MNAATTNRDASTTAFYAGQRVAATRYGALQHGTVTRTAQGVRTRLTDGVIVWVRWDDAARETWMHGSSLVGA